MLIRSRSGERITNVNGVLLDQYTPTGKYALLASDGLDPEGIIIGLYDTKADLLVVSLRKSWTKSKGDN